MVWILIVMFIIPCFSKTQLCWATAYNRPSHPVQWFLVWYSQIHVTITAINIRACHASKRNFIPFSCQPQPLIPSIPSPKQPLIYSYLQISLFWTSHVNKIIPYMTFCNCLLSFTHNAVHVHSCSSMQQYFTPLVIKIMFHCFQIKNFIYSCQLMEFGFSSPLAIMNNPLEYLYKTLRVDKSFHFSWLQNI